MELTKYTLVLGSKSPRRKELLEKAGLSFIQRVIETDESYPADLSIELIAEHIAIQKAKAHTKSLEKGELLLTADTIVVMDAKVYGKPASTKEAVETIMHLQNKVHLVYSGVCLMTSDSLSSFSEMSEVKFGTITQQEADDYVKNFNPLDKAGSYGIQDWIGFTRIEWIKGSYTNILGLPMSQVYDTIKSMQK